MSEWKPGMLALCTVTHQGHPPHFKKGKVYKVKKHFISHGNHRLDFELDELGSKRNGWAADFFIPLYNLTKLEEILYGVKD